jgi:predicted PurR-regulated permease PerM
MTTHPRREATIGMAAFTWQVRASHWRYRDLVDLPSGAVSTEDPLVPGWLARLAAIGWRALVTLALGVVLWALVQQLATVAASIILALILAATLAPYVNERRARGWSRSKAAGVVSLGALLVFIVAITVIVLALAPTLSAIIGAFDAGIQAFGAQLAALGVPADVTAIFQRISDTIRSGVLSALSGVVATGAAVVTIAILGGFLTFFLLLDGDKAWDWVLASTGGWRREALIAGGRRALDQVGGYTLGTALIAAASAALAGVIMAVLGVPFAGPLAVLMLLGAFVPYVGRALVTLVVVAITFATRGAIPAVVLLGLFVVGAIVLDRVLGARTAGRRLELHPILAVVGLPLGLAAAGYAGLVVILPILAFAQTAAGVLITALGREPIAAMAASPALATSSGGVPVWLDRLGQWSWRSLIVAAMFFVVAQVALLFPGVIMPVVIAIILAATLEPAAGALERRGLGRGTAAMVVTVATSAVIVTIVVFTLAALAGPIGDVAATAVDGAETSGAQAVGVASFVGAISTGLVGTVASGVANILGIVVVLLLGGFLTFYFIRDGGRVWRAVTRAVPADRRGPLDAAGTRAVDVLGGYMVGTAAISAFGAASQFVIMVILGLPLALPLAILALFAGFIPYIGGFIATALAFLVAVQSGDSTDIVIMFVYTIVFNIVQGNFVTPLVYGKAVSLHPAIVLMAVPIGNALAGIVGMFLVVPVAGVIATTWRAVLHTIEGGDVVEPGPLPSTEPGGDVTPTVPSVVVGGSP